MLLSLTADNLTLIDHEEIEFGEGLNILTGETGAGKSILLGALKLTLGGKAGRDIIRDEKKDAYAEAVFSVGERERAALLKLGIETYDGEVILSRRISSRRSVAKINGETVPAPMLSKAGDVLIDIYGQRDNQTLLRKQKHLQLLDDYARDSLAPVLSRLKDEYKNYRSLEKKLMESDTDEKSRLREADFLRQEISEIESAGLVPGEDDELEKSYRLMKNTEKIAAGIAEITEETGGDNAALDLIGRAMGTLNNISDMDPDGIGPLASMLSDCEGILEDFVRSIGEYRDSLEFDREDFSRTEDRLDLINTLKTKYGSTIEIINDTLSEKKDRLRTLENFDEYIAGLKKDLAESKKRLDKICEETSALRKKAAEKLSDKVKEAMEGLNFSDVRFSMRFERLPDYTEKGYDDPEFYVSLNPGEPEKPLISVASGGELSRIMLAMKTVLADTDDVDTLIFDEVDTGISGRTAQCVSERLSEVADRRQVICITHLPQIASMADTHFLVEKSVSDGQTLSGIREISGSARIDELSRMLGGSEITDIVRDSANEMIEMADREKITRRQEIKRGVGK